MIFLCFTDCPCFIRDDRSQLVGSCEVFKFFDKILHFGLLFRAKTGLAGQNTGGLADEPVSVKTATADFNITINQIL